MPIPRAHIRNGARDQTLICPADGLHKHGIDRWPEADRMSEEGRSRIFMAVIAALVGIIVFAFLCNHPFLETLGVVTVVFILSSLVFGASYLA